MNDNQQKSILQMARGAILERADYEDGCADWEGR